jgi:hypothetical protein
MRKDRVFIIDNNAKNLVNLQEQIEGQWGQNVSISVFHSPRAVLTHLIKEQTHKLNAPEFIYVNLTIEDKLSVGFLEDLKVFEIIIEDTSILFSNQLPENPIVKKKISNKRIKINQNLLNPLSQKHISQ